MFDRPQHPNYRVYYFPGIISLRKMKGEREEEKGDRGFSSLLWYCILGMEMRSELEKAKRKRGMMYGIKKIKEAWHV